ncbi:unnamed protein product [Trypanosoma congolense IL3000]|uniref:WGS project CAEQ00000000 data, annotated contig 1591 n=1 Tax=Trypanosoma congolense (strain IL3000) TaxID=1068625 RepID=F9W7D5_TRYCI|nr:unnamed protein product [Trypanosoma congolense IL3000]
MHRGCSLGIHSHVKLLCLCTRNLAGIGHLSVVPGFSALSRPPHGLGQSQQTDAGQTHSESIAAFPTVWSEVNEHGQALSCVCGHGNSLLCRLLLFLSGDAEYNPGSMKLLIPSGCYQPGRLQQHRVAACLSDTGNPFWKEVVEMRSLQFYLLFNILAWWFELHVVAT